MPAYANKNAILKSSKSDPKVHETSLKYQVQWLLQWVKLQAAHFLLPRIGEFKLQTKKMLIDYMITPEIGKF
ncbi:hypothetical protein AXF42_Ash016347 [Apostasia shenzhenica]|uniref:Uncharacterized protein n=1 Tax=Apostasia shenzhenica TaxID=1088818 RepID=A0A2H9ZXH9_9ASPA|nr:hypothetical protein AXF42_Ash016347 [Apostasia shenzhenica]